jgi:hypothetical protein
LKIWEVFGSSAAMTNHSVFGVMMMFLTLSTMSMALTPEWVLDGTDLVLMTTSAQKADGK